MKEVFKEIPFGIEHTLKVLKNAEDIMNGENIREEEKEFISSTAIRYDIGAVEAQKIYIFTNNLHKQNCCIHQKQENLLKRIILH